MGRPRGCDPLAQYPGEPAVAAVEMSRSCSRDPFSFVQHLHKRRSTIACAGFVRFIQLLDNALFNEEAETLVGLMIAPGGKACDEPIALSVTAVILPLRRYCRGSTVAGTHSLTGRSKQRHSGANEGRHSLCPTYCKGCDARIPRSPRCQRGSRMWSA